jgi:hypothetical protein
MSLIAFWPNIQVFNQFPSNNVFKTTQDALEIEIPLKWQRVASCVIKWDEVPFSP